MINCLTSFDQMSYRLPIVDVTFSALYYFVPFLSLSHNFEHKGKQNASIVFFKEAC
jgi:hypothetical protein